MTITALLAKLGARRRAASVTESALLIALICLVSLAVVSLTGREIACRFEKVANKLGHTGTESCQLLADALDDAADQAGDPTDVGTGDPNDSIPDPFYFTDIFNEGLGEKELVLSNGVRVKNFTGELPVSVATDDDYALADEGIDLTSRGEVSIGGREWATTGLVVPGERIRLRVRAPARSKAVKVHVHVGSVTGSWIVATRSRDNVPDFSLSDRTGVGANSVQGSGWITLFGFDDPVDLRVEGQGAGLIVNGENEPSLTRTVHPGDFAFFQVQAPDAACDGASTLNFYGNDVLFKSWTVNLPACQSGSPGSGPGGSGPSGGSPPAPGTPQAPAVSVLDFGTLSNLDPSAPVESAAAQIPAEITAPTAMSLSPLSAAMASVNGGPWVAAPLVSAGDTVRLKALAPGQPGYSDDIFVSVGSILGRWSLSTKPAFPDPVNFVAVPASALSASVTSSTAVMTPFYGTLSVSVSAGSPGSPVPDLMVNGSRMADGRATLKSGDRIEISLQTPATFATDVSPVLSIAGMAPVKWTVVTRREVTSPPSLDVPAKGLLELSTLTTSDAVTIPDFDGEAGISVSGAGNPLLSLNNGPYLASGTVRGGDVLRVQATSPADYESEIPITVTSGATTGVWRIGTRPADVTPDGFGFAAKSGLESEQVVVSESVTISGIEIPVSVSAASAQGDGQVSINNGPWLSGGQAVSGDTLRLRATAPVRMGYEKIVVASVGKSKVDWVLNTRPSAFPFSDVADTEQDVVITSNAVTVAYLSAPATVTLSGDSTAVLVINGNPSGTQATISNGDQLSLRVRSSASFAGEKNLVLLSSGTLTDRADWKVSTRARKVVPQLSGPGSVDGVNPASEVVSDAFTVSSLDGTVGMTVQGGQVAVNSASPAWSDRVDIANGTQLRLRMTSSDQYLATTGVTMSVVEAPAFSKTWTVRTRERDLVADGFTIPQVLNAQTSSVVASSEIGVSGFDGALPVTVSVDTPDASNVQFRVDGGDWRTSGSISPGQKIQLRVTTSQNQDEIYNFGVRIGDYDVGSWQMITGPDKYPDPVSFPTTENAVPNSFVTSPSVTVSGLSVTVPAYVSLESDTVLIKNGIDVTGSQNTTVFNGDTLAVRARTASGYQQVKIASVQIGDSFMTTWTVRTHASNASPPVWVSASDLGNAGQFTSYSKQLQVTAVNQPVTYTKLSGTLPGTMTLSSTGLIQGTSSTLGSSFFMVRATDSKGLFADRPFQLTVNNLAPIWEPNLSLGSVKANVAMAGIVVDGATDPEGQALTYSTVSGSPLPAGITFDASNRTLKGTPTTTGSFTFKLSVSDGSNAPVEATFGLGISPTPSAQSCNTDVSLYSASVFGGDGGCVFSFTGVDKSWTVPVSVTSIEVKLWGGGGSGTGAGGPGSDSSNVRVRGGGGGFATAIIQTTPGETLVFRTGRGGSPSGSEGGSGGGYSGIFRGTATLGNEIVIAGGGGGGARPDSSGGATVGGGAGGGTTGQNGGTSASGAGGTQTTGAGRLQGGSTGNSGAAGGWPGGGNGSSGGWGGSGGGGGYWGGGAGASGGGGTGGAGGGGSGYLKPGIISGQLLGGVGQTPGFDLDMDRGGFAVGGNRGVSGGNGRIVISW